MARRRKASPGGCRNTKGQIRKGCRLTKGGRLVRK